jgi:uncharacterized protein YjbI with pentapeptide repeats
MATDTALKKRLRWLLSGKRPLWAAAIVVVLLILWILSVVIKPIANYATAQPQNATLVAALIALLGILVTQVVNTILARIGQRNQQVLEERRARAASLQSYLEQMRHLLIARHEHGDTASISKVIRAHTLAVLEGLDDPARKRIVLQFLRESDLIPRQIQGRQNKIVDLSGADLSNADLSQLNLRKAGLDGAFLTQANLRKGYLPGADLGGTRLYGADLTGARLVCASLREARLQDRPDLGLKAASLRGADLRRADLRDADLRGVDLAEADLSHADLTGADLRGAIVTDAQLETARSREGTSH